jgi:hypothetical protein
MANLMAIPTSWLYTPQSGSSKPFSGSHQLNATHQTRHGDRVCAVTIGLRKSRALSPQQSNSIHEVSAIFGRVPQRCPAFAERRPCDSTAFSPSSSINVIYRALDEDSDSATAWMLLHLLDQLLFCDAGDVTSLC